MEDLDLFFKKEAKAWESKWWTAVTTTTVAVNVSLHQVDADAADVLG